MEAAHEVYAELIAGLREIGFRDALLEENYGFGDWFTPRVEQREIAAAAFGQTPVSYDSALIGIARANGIRELALVNQYRALGAPIILEIDVSEIREWAVSYKESDHTLLARYPVDRIGEMLARRAREWRPDTFLRAKNIGEFTWSPQLELFSGLLPELEEHIQEKLDPLLRDTLWSTKEAYRETTDRHPDEAKLFKLVFWLLTAKVFRDRHVKGFESLGPEPDELLAAVAKHYRSEVPALLTRNARLVAASRIWADLDFRNLSVEVLAHIWSTTLIDPHTTRRLGIHRTSRTIVRYMVEQIPFETFGDDKRIILEPCAGSAVFLIGAMNVLRQKWYGVLPSDRHAYFTSHLTAIERDPFGVEISTLALTLADFPNPNGWNVRHDDVFKPGTLSEHLKHAGVVLCNPPFGDFDDDERRVYEISSTKKPVELLNRVLDDLHPAGVIGFVLPRLFLDGRGYSAVRKRLAQRFATLDVTSLPDRAFKADAEIALLIAKDPIPHNTCQITIQKVNDTPTSWRNFELWHKLSSKHASDLSMREVERGLPIPDLPQVWKHLADYPTLREHATLGRGIEWNKPLTIKGHETGYRDLLVSRVPLEGYMRGVAPRSTFNVFEVPEMAYLSIKQEDERINARPDEWRKRKAILNKAARSRGAWRLAAFPDSEGVTCYQTFIGVWPKSERYDEWLLSAILNSPVANAFIATREGKTDVTIETLQLIPIPRFTNIEAKRLRELIARYQQAIDLPLLRGESSETTPERLLKEIDAAVLRAYHIPPRLERELLDFFRGHTRPTSHQFGEYFPGSMDVFFSLFDYLSPQFAMATVGDLRRRLSDTHEDISK